MEKIQSRQPEAVRTNCYTHRDVKFQFKHDLQPKIGLAANNEMGRAQV